MSTVGKLVVLKLDGDSSEYGFRATLEISSEGDRPSIEVTGKLPPAPELLTNLSQWQEIYRSLGQQNRIEPIEMTFGGSVNNLEVCRQSANTLRDRMKAWLNSQSFHPISKALDRELSIDEPIRFLIRTQDRYLRHLPWHYWDFFEYYSQAEFALSSLSYKQVNPIKPANKKEKVKILAILGNSAGIDIEKDRSFLENLDENAEVVFLVEKSRQEINNDLWEQSWDILYFAGHSKTLKSKTKEEQGIIEINSHDKLTIDELKYGLQQTINNGLQLAIFNSCDGLGLAYELEQLNLPQLILMRQPVPDQVAQEFLKHFLKAFVGGDSLYVAERKARERLQGLEGEFPCASWLPVICQNPASVPPTWQELLGNKNNGINNLTQALVGNTQIEEGQGDKLPGENYLPDGDNSERRINFWHRLGTVFLASTLVTGLVMGVRSLGILQGLELQAYDQMIRSRPQEFPDNRFVIISITEQDLQLPEQEQRGIGHLADRALYLLLKKLEPHEPRVIGLDLLRDFKVNPKYKKDLANRLGGENFIGICYSGNTRDTSIAAPFQVPSAQIGFNDVVPDKPYNILRRQILQVEFDTSLCSASEAFSFKVAEHFLKKEGIIPDFPQGKLRLGKVVFKPLEARSSGYQNLDASGHQVLLNFRSVTGSSLNVSNIQFTLGQVLENKVNLDIVRDKIVLIGVDSKTANDYFLTPYKKEIPGVIVHAQMISQILGAVLDKRPLLSVWSFWIEILWVWGWSLISGSLASLFWRSPIKLGILGCVVLSSLYIICYIFLIPDVCKNLKVSSVWIPFIPPTLSLIITSGCIIILFEREKSYFLIN